MQIMQPLPANTAGRAELSPSYPPSYPQKVNPSAKYADPPAKYAVPPCKVCSPSLQILQGVSSYPQVIPKVIPKKSISLQNMQTPLQIMQSLPANTAGGVKLSPSYPQSYPQKVNPSAKYADPPANHAVPLCKICRPPCKYCRGCQVIPKQIGT